MKYRLEVSLQVPCLVSLNKGAVVDSIAIPSVYLDGWIKSGFVTELPDEAPVAHPEIKPE